VAESLRGKTVVVTGASAGIGAAAVRALAKAGATVVPIGRSPEKTASIAAELGTDGLVADFADLASVRRLAVALHRRNDRIDAFVHNAGGMVKERELTVDGHERTIQTNYLAPFLLQALLKEHLALSGARILVTSSVAHHLGTLRLSDLDAHDRSYSMVRAYAASKLADLLFARELARRGMIAAAFDPGFVATDFLLPATGLAADDPSNSHGLHRLRRTALRVVQPEVAATGIVRFVALDDAAALSGQLLSRSRAIPSSPRSRSAKLGTALWDATEELIGV
jgi:NAD(P)-dependent dehydrogenase (short-subunit alcohol dehydrogenase family)